METIRTLIVDDHCLVRQGLYHLLNGVQDIEAVGEAADGEGALKMAKKLKPDVIILDICMPSLNGLETLHLVREALPETRFLILSMHMKTPCIHQALTFGALGYVIKTAPGEDLIKAIRTVARGHYFLSPEINEDVIRSFLQKDRKEQPESKYDLLSEREQQIFRLVVEGWYTKEIANLLFVSAKTIEKHRSNIIKKLDTHDSLAMMKFAVKIGVSDPAIWPD